MITTQQFSRRSAFALAGAFTLAALAACSETKPPDGDLADPNGPSVSLANDAPAAANFLGGLGALSISLLQAAGEDAGKDNSVISPFSISQAMAMVAQGAKGPTLTELAALFDCSDAADLAAGANAQLTALLGLKKATVGIGNTSFVEEGFKIKKEYAATLEKYFGVAPHLAPFNKDPEAGRELINKWVSERTKEKIPELLAEGQVKNETRLVLVNAIYLKALWKNQFNPNRTSPGEFQTGDKTIEVDKMHDDRGLNYAEIDGVEFVELPYEDDGLTAYVVMPELGKIDQFVGSLTSETLFGGIDMLKEASGEIHLPKFEVRQRIELKKTLQALGVTTAFGDSADFSGTSDEATFLSFVQHEAWIKVGEKGTEAAAATAGGMDAGSAAPDEKITVDINRPFVFVVMDKTTQSVVFSTIVRDPSK